jgi:Leucine-rich repeat (LRR) protein
LTENNNQNGTIPSELFAQTSFDSLSLVYGSLYGTIPTEIGQLTNVRVLQFAYQSLTGQIPEEIDRLTSMETLNLFSNKLTGTIPPNTFHGKSGKNRLENIVFSINKLEGTIPEFDPQSEMKLLLLDDNLLTGALPTSLFIQPALRELHVQNNFLSGTLDPSVGALTALTELHLSGNDFSGTIPTRLALLKNLKTCLLAGNALVGMIPSKLGEMRSVEQLDLSSNQFTGAIPVELAFLAGLEILNLASNELTGSVPLELSELRKLGKLFLQETSVTAGLSTAFCNDETILTTDIHADCGGDVPEIECDCCTTCCEGEECELSLIGMCELAGGGFMIEEERGTSCACSEGGKTLTCSDSTCESCNADGSVCVTNNDYGYIFDETTGEPVSFRNTFQYVKGRDETIVFSRVFSEEQCEVTVNGEKCDSCSTITCASGYNGYAVQCENVAPGYSMKSCEPRVEVGFLEVFFIDDPSIGTGCPPIIFNPEGVE